MPVDHRKGACGNGAGPRPTSQRQAAAKAGLSKHQEKQAKRVAAIPRDEFEALIESDSPPTVTALAARGTRKRRCTSAHIRSRVTLTLAFDPARVSPAEIVDRLGQILEREFPDLDDVRARCVPT
jgi:hypothetical protein